MYLTSMIIYEHLRPILLLIANCQSFTVNTVQVKRKIILIRYL